MRARSIVAPAILAIAAAWGCSLVTSYDGFTGSAPPPCGKHPPEKPSDDAPGDVGTLIGVTKTSIFLGEGGTQIGFDLDNLCTCPEKPACKAATGKTECDTGGPKDGIDDAVNVLVGNFSTNQAAGPLMDDAYAHGHHGLLVVVKNWNGRNDDPSVVVQVYNTSQVNDGGTAKYDNADVFDVAKEYLLDTVSSPPAPQYFDNQAWVAGGILVAHITPTLRFRFIAPTVVPGGSSAVDIVLNEAVLSGKLNKPPVPGGLSIDGLTIAGRMPDSALLKAIGMVGVCADQYAGAKLQACAHVDLPTLHANDGKANATCTSMSFAFLAPIVPAKLGGIVSAPLGPDLCNMPDDKCN